MAAEKVQKHIYISGRVQGVGFRAFIREQAAVLDIKGWAKNLTDGRVEVVIQGQKNNIKQMILKLKEGPSFARVDDFEINDEKVDNYKDFEIRF
ncbi:acylphosphatase [Halanaerobium saccharolyticum]|uniref:Acylphosphatase n=1 Tax=Halanaerobium saccharolyticum TaxID=43595 RepID=A0A4V3G5X6_9FIRM|nr:acylphosphatase [Halanaerobium saccharolyticum]RAK11157.1 acylphosphatase [Halanaerobium saccharolyticum]TDW07008.1 acylphosphatase [Halanaerobium saccharolyticum]TDX63773.1 acylphosphatase [Halanaerobium saccharolyticum]